MHYHDTFGKRVTDTGKDYKQPVSRYDSLWKAGGQEHT